MSWDFMSHLPTHDFDGTPVWRVGREYQIGDLKASTIKGLKKAWYSREILLGTTWGRQWVLADGVMGVVGLLATHAIQWSCRLVDSEFSELASGMPPLYMLQHENGEWSPMTLADIRHPSMESCCRDVLAKAAILTGNQAVEKLTLSIRLRSLAAGPADHVRTELVDSFQATLLQAAP